MAMLSVVMPTFNRAAMLRQTLQAFCRLDVDVDWEILVIDNGSSDATANVVAEVNADALPLRYLYESRQGKNHANNLGIEHARGSILVFCDDDITPNPDWLQQIVASTERWPNHVFFGGRVLPQFPPNTYQFIRYCDFSSYVYAIQDLEIPEGEYPVAASPNGPNCWVRAKVFQDGMRYDGSIGPKGRGRVSGSELEFFTRLAAEGHRPIYVPSATVHHRIQPSQTTFSYLLRRSFASGRGHARIFGFPSECQRLAGVPRYLYRELAEYAVASAASLVCGSPKSAFERIMKCSVILGAMLEARELGKQPYC